MVLTENQIREIIMFKKLIVLTLIVNCSTAIFAQADYMEKWNAAYKLYRAAKYAEAGSAFEKLAGETSNPGNKYNCYIYAGYSARNIKKYDEAVAFTEKAAKVENPYLYQSITRKIDFMYSAAKYKEILEMFPVDEIMKWPKCYRSDALYYIGLAQYNLKKGEDAEKTFAIMYENAENPNTQANALLRKGHNYRHRLNDVDKATAAYKEVVAVADSYPNYKCEAYDALGQILASQKKYDEALAEYDKLIGMKKVNAYWKSRSLYNKGNVFNMMGKKEDAVKSYKQAIATKGVAGWVKNACEAQLKKLESEAGKKE